jgi:hypothetical protein
MEFKVTKINDEITKQANKHYTSAFQQALMNKAMLRLEVDNLLSSKNLLNREQEEEDRETLEKEIKLLEIQLKSAQLNGQRMTKAEGRQIAIDIRNKRRELNSIGASRGDMYDQTAEKQAENERIQYMVYATCLNPETGRRFWDSYEDFKLEKNTELVTGAFKAFYLEVANINLDAVSETYENKWLRRAGFLSESGKLIDLEGRLVDEEGRLINEEGRFVDQNGNLVDRYGNRVDENGELQIEDGWDFDSDTKTPQTESAETVV